MTVQRAVSGSRFEAAQLHYKTRIKKFAVMQRNDLPAFDEDDIEQEILECLWMACNTYDPNAGAKFNTYFWELTHRRISDLHRMASAAKRAGDYKRVWLEDEEVAAAVAEATATDSAESVTLARIAVQERWRSKKS